MDFDRKNGIETFEHFVSRELHHLSIEELVFIHLFSRHSTPLKNCSLVSSLYDLTETLSASFGNIRTNQYVPLMVAFSILDQIGSLYHLKDQSPKYTNGIKRSLSSFSDFPESFLNTLVSLRHGLFHDGSLLYINKNINNNVFFRLRKDTGQVITAPKKVWDGEFHDDLDDYVTLVDLKELQKLVLSVIERCRDAFLANKLAITITDPKEFYFKFLFAIR